MPLLQKLEIPHNHTLMLMLPAKGVEGNIQAYKGELVHAPQMLQTMPLKCIAAAMAAFSSETPSDTCCIFKIREWIHAFGSLSI